jgi:hypothetical protein
MTSQGKKPKALAAAQVRKVVLGAIANGAYIESFSFHARFDHPERHLSIDDVIHGLKKPWRGCKVDEFNDDEWQWRYLIKTSDIEEFPLVVIVGLDPKNNRFTVVTSFYDD